jgi:DNA-binding transcriptional ArsR family regulator
MTTMLRGKIDAGVAPAPPEALAPLFRVLGDPTRLRILRALLEGERTVSELVEITAAPQSRVSNHLACLRWCRMVEGRREGRTIHYRLCDPRVEGLLREAGDLAATNAEYLASCTRIGPDWV